MGCFKKVAAAVLPQLGVLGGATNGLIQGGGVSGAIKGGVQGGALAAGEILGGPALGSALGIGPILGTGLGGAIGGAAGQAVTGGNPLTGALEGGIGGLGVGSLANGGLSSWLGGTSSLSDTGYRSNFYSTVHTAVQPTAIARLFVPPIWSVRMCSFTDFEAVSDFAEVTIESSNPVLVHGVVADVRVNGQRVIEPLIAAGLSGCFECYDEAKSLILSKSFAEACRDA